MPAHVGEHVLIDEVLFTILLGHHVQNDAGDDEQQADHDQQHGTDERGEAQHHTGVPEVDAYGDAESETDDADDATENGEERHRLVFAD